MISSENDTKHGIKILDRTQTKEPVNYLVILLNDDYTPMDFVTHILQKFFHKSREEAETVMMQVHQQGRGIAGIYNYETAETKVHLVNTYSDQQKHALQCIMEKE
jgi:ATP-dependent Clp protease adaptor protein ClpS